MGRKNPIFPLSCRQRASGSQKTNMDSISYIPNDGALLDTSKHIGMAHTIYIHITGTDTDT